MRASCADSGIDADGAGPHARFEHPLELRLSLFDQGVHERGIVRAPARVHEVFEVALVAVFDPEGLLHRGFRDAPVSFADGGGASDKGFLFEHQNGEVGIRFERHDGRGEARSTRARHDEVVGFVRQRRVGWILRQDRAGTRAQRREKSG